MSEELSLNVYKARLFEEISYSVQVGLIWLMLYVRFIESQSN